MYCHHTHESQQNLQDIKLIIFGIVSYTIEGYLDSIYPSFICPYIGVFFILLSKKVHCLDGILLMNVNFLEELDTEIVNFM